MPTDRAGLPSHSHLAGCCNIKLVVCFVAAGHDERFTSVDQVVQSVRPGVLLDATSVPSVRMTDRHGRVLPLNRYILDFWGHGQKKALVLANGLREGAGIYFCMISCSTWTGPAANQQTYFVHSITQVMLVHLLECPCCSSYTKAQPCCSTCWHNASLSNTRRWDAVWRRCAISFCQVAVCMRSLTLGLKG